MIETSSGLPRKPSAIFGKCSGMLMAGLHNNFGKSSENIGKWLEIFGKSSTMLSSVIVYVRYVLINFMFSWQELYSTCSLHSLVRYCSLPLKHKIHIFSPPCNILYVIVKLLKQMYKMGNSQYTTGP